VHLHGCLLCGQTPTENAHWPYAIGMGRKRRKVEGTLPSVPLCLSCHHAAHWGNQEIVEQLIDRAPGHWVREGLWDANEEKYSVWLSKRRLRVSQNL
jgi:hypothetical protein